MSTRAVIATWTDKREGHWQGAYHHWDGYPSGLGASLYALLHKSDIEKWVQTLTRDHTAWSTINGADWALTPGFSDSNWAPCVKCGLPTWRHYRQYYQHTSGDPEIAQKAEATLAALSPAARAAFLADSAVEVFGHRAEHDDEAPKRPECYCHGTRHEENEPMTDHDAAASGVEWAYVIDPAARTMTVLEASLDGRHSTGFFGMGAPDASWIERAVVFVDNPEPDWNAIS